MAMEWLQAPVEPGMRAPSRSYRLVAQGAAGEVDGVAHGYAAEGVPGEGGARVGRCCPLGSDGVGQVGDQALGLAT